jgi:hypothetical protein
MSEEAIRSELDSSKGDLKQNFSIFETPYLEEVVVGENK